MAVFDKTAKFFCMPKDEAVKRLCSFMDVFFPQAIRVTIRDFFSKHHKTPSWRTRREAKERDVENLVTLIAEQPTVGAQARLIAGQDLELQYCLWERFFAFEQLLRDLPDGEEFSFRADFGDFLREGLIESWRLRKQHRYFD